MNLVPNPDYAAAPFEIWIVDEYGKDIVPWFLKPRFATYEDALHGINAIPSHITQ